MNKKTIFIVGGVIAALGIGYYLWTKRKKDSKVGSTEEAKKSTTDENVKVMEQTGKKAESKLEELSKKPNVDAIRSQLSNLGQKIKLSGILKQQQD